MGCLLVPGETGKKSQLMLLEACVLKKTLRRYKKEYLFFLQYVLNTGAEVSGAEQLDATLYDYLLELFMENDGRGKSVALNTVCGVKLYNPGLASRLPLSAKALIGYDKLSPSEAYPPMSRGLA